MEIILQSDTTMNTTARSLPQDVTIKSEDDTPFTVTNTADFTVDNGCSLTLENVIFTSTDSKAFNVNNGTLVTNDAVTLAGNRVVVNDGTYTLNEGTIINGNYAQSCRGGSGAGVYVYQNGAVFNMYGGIITSNTATMWGGGVLIYQNSNFTMEDGEISSNTVGNDGGGVHTDKCIFIMKGGTISGNKANRDGGGINVYNSTFTMEGGEISNNTATNSVGGLYVNSTTFNLSGAPVVKENKLTNGTVSNVYLLNGTPIKLTGALTEGAEVWINYPNTKDTIFATATTAADAANSVSYFRNDADSTLLAGARDTSLIWGLVVAQIWDGNSKTTSNYHTLKAAIADYTDSTTQVIQLLENIAETATVDKDLYLNLNGKNVTGALTLNDNCTLYRLDSATDGYTTSNYGKISTINGNGTVAAITPIAAAHTTKAKSYLKVTEGDEVSFHRYNVQVYDYYFRLVFDENDPADTGSAMISFSSAVQGNSHVADAITELETSYTPAGGGGQNFGGGVNAEGFEGCPQGRGRSVLLQVSFHLPQQSLHSSVCFEGQP